MVNAWAASGYIGYIGYDLVPVATRSNLPVSIKPVILTRLSEFLPPEFPRLFTQVT
jgi:hypothetical protein